MIPDHKGKQVVDSSRLRKMESLNSTIKAIQAASNHQEKDAGKQGKIHWCYTMHHTGLQLELLVNDLIVAKQYYHVCVGYYNVTG